MTKEELQQGISILYDMELNDYLMERTINELDEQIGSLGYKKRFSQPQKKSVSANFDYCVWCGFIFAVIGAIIMLINGYVTYPGGFFVKLIEGILEGILGAVIGGIVGIIIGAFVAICKKGAAKEEEDRKYQENLAKLESAKKSDNIRVSNEIEQMKILSKERNLLTHRKNEARQKLSKYYSIMNIDSNYCHLLPIGYMYEFIRLGISTHLEGADGLYYLVRKELRMEQLQYSVEEISQKLDTIIDNQHEIYSQLSDMNDKCDVMISQAVKSAKANAQNKVLLEQAVKNSSITAYNSERLTREVGFQNFMIALSSRR